MGIYSTNRLDMSGINVDDIVANESYSGLVGIQRILIEEHENDMRIFEAVLRNDMQEVYGLKEGTILESELSALQEASIKGLWETIKTALKEFWKKVLGVIENFKNKFLDTIHKANTKLLEDKQKKLEKKDLSKMTYKWRKVNEDESLTKGLMEIDSLRNSKMEALKGATAEKAQESISEYNDNKLTNEFLKTLLGKETTTEKFVDDYIERVFDKETDMVGLSASELDKIIKDLSTMHKDKKAVEDAKKTVNATCKKTLSDIAKTEKETSSKAADNNYREGVVAAAKIAECCRLIINSWKAAQLSYISAQFKCIKIRTTQNRYVLSKAAAWDPKAVGESAEFEIFAECDSAELEELITY